MGLRLRLRANYPPSGFPYQVRVVLKALKRYGMIVADNGSSWYLTGAPNPGWDNDQLHTLGKVKGVGLPRRRHARLEQRFRCATRHTSVTGAPSSADR
jgi:hypothetical protein